MRIRHLALWTALAASLAAQGSEQGFFWVGARGGSLSFDPREHVKPASLTGVQGGMVFDQQRYGLTLEAFSSHPKSEFDSSQKLTHSEVSLTLLTGLFGATESRFWPYLGLGLVNASVPIISSSTLALETARSLGVHASLGFTHRPGYHLIWGVEGRYVMTFTKQDLKEFQGSAMVGFTWGGRPPARKAEADAPVPEPKAAPAPVPVPVVEDAPPPPLPPPAPVTVAPPPVVPEPVTEAAPPPPPPPPPPPLVVIPVAAEKSTPEPALPTATGSSLTRRLDALLLGDMALAVELGRKRIEAIPPNHWTIRLEIADLTSTLKSAVGAFPAGKPDLFIAPIKLRGGRTSYQLFLGDYPSKAAAEQAAKRVPASFLEGGQRPKPFLGTGIPK